MRWAVTSRRRKVSIDEPGFYGYIGGGRHLLVQPPPVGSALRAMFEFMPADEDCPSPDCYKCKPTKQSHRQRQEEGATA
jgi:hypothetical protein